MDNEIINNATVEISEVASILDQFVDSETKNSILTALNDISVKPEISNDDVANIQEDATDKETTPKVRKQWGILISDPENTIQKEYMGWVFQMDEDENIAEANDKIIVAAAEFNRSKKGSKCPVKTIGEACMFVPNKFFKEQKIYIKNKEPVYVNLTNNKLESDKI